MTEDKNNGAREKYRVTIVGFLCNIGLMIFKFIAGILGHSSAMIADALHSLSDLVSDLVVLFSVRMASKKDDSEHQYGYGKYETLGTLIIGLMLFGVGLEIFWSAGKEIWKYLENIPLEEPGVIALIAALISIAVKEWLYRYTLQAGRKLDSRVLQANAWHHRSDALSSIAAAIGISGAIVLGEKWRILDPIAAIFVSLLVGKMAASLFIPAINELLEQSLPKSERKIIIDVLKEFPQVSKPHNLRTRRIGPSRSVEMHVRMPGDMSVNDSHLITRKIEKKLREKLGKNTFINIHVEPEKDIPANS